jgi:hypothetical protein
MSGFKLSKNSFPAGDQPLGLTVHSVPTPEQSVGGDERRRFSGRWKMLLVMLVCAAPVMASYFTYYVVRPDGRRSFGELIDPQRTAPDATAIALDGSKANLLGLKGQWTLLSVAGGACDAVCVHNLYLQRQLREGLGKEKDRVDWVWLVSDDAPVPPAIQPGLKTATVLRLPAEQIASWLSPASGHALSEHLYVIDPMGNWMMRFPAQLSNEDAPKAKRDIERLLRASASWDQPGREPRP